MAFLDETGLAELWSHVKAEDAKAPRIVIGSYVGDGNFNNVNNPHGITFAEEPTYLAILGYGTSSFAPAWGKYTNNAVAGMYVKKLTTAWQQMGFNSGVSQVSKAKISSDRKTIYWYCSSTSGNGSYEYNLAGETYYYAAFYF